MLVLQSVAAPEKRFVCTRVFMPKPRQNALQRLTEGVLIEETFDGFFDRHFDTSVTLF